MRLVHEDACSRMSSQYCLKWNNHRNNLLSAFDHLLTLEAFTDVTLACEDGITLQAHRMVLASCSSYFQSLFLTAHHTHYPIVVLKDVRAADMKALLAYMYRGEVNVKQSALQRLLKVAEGLKVKGLVEELASDPLTGSLAPRLCPLSEGSPPCTEVSRPPSSSDSRTSTLQSSRRSTSPPTLPRIRLSRPPSLDRLKEGAGAVHSPQSPHYPLMLAEQINLSRGLSLSRGYHMDPGRDFRDVPPPPRIDINPPSSSSGDDLRSHRPLSHSINTTVPPMPSSPPLKRPCHFLQEPLLSTTPILRTALGQQTEGSYPQPDVSSLVSLASSIIPISGLLSSHVPRLVSPQDPPESAENSGSHAPSRVKLEAAEEEARDSCEGSREEEQDRKPNGLYLSDISSYHMESTNPSYYSNFVSYVPSVKPEWKRYKQYTKTDLMEAIDAVRNGMTALQASRKYKVPSRTLYDKIKKMGISTLPRRMPSKKPSTTDLEGGMDRSPPPSSVELHEHSSDADLRMLRDVNGSPEGHHPAEEDLTTDVGSQSHPSALGFSVVGRTMFKSESSIEATPLDLSDSESLLSKRPEIEERA